jgi:hypothetical protein
VMLGRGRRASVAGSPAQCGQKTRAGTSRPTDETHLPLWLRLADLRKVFRLRANGAPAAIAGTWKVPQWTNTFPKRVTGVASASAGLSQKIPRSINTGEMKIVPDRSGWLIRFRSRSISRPRYSTSRPFSSSSEVK